MSIGAGRLAAVGLYSPYMYVHYSVSTEGLAKAVLCSCWRSPGGKQASGRQTIDCPRRTVGLVLLEAESHLMLSWRMDYSVGARCENGAGDWRCQLAITR